MRKIRFPKSAYVRRLASLYDELGYWREYYAREGNEAYWNDGDARFVDRLIELESIQHDLSSVIDSIRWMADLS